MKSAVHLGARKAKCVLSLHTIRMCKCLSRSLGTPQNLAEDANAINDNLYKSINEYENGFTNLNQELQNLENKKIQDTGFSLTPLFSGLGFIAVVAICVLFPSVLTILFFVLKRTRSALQNIVTGIKEFSDNDPDNAKNLHQLLEQKLDRVEKKLKYRMESNG